MKLCGKREDVPVEPLLGYIEMTCVWCGRGAGVDAIDGATPIGWFSYQSPREVKPAPQPHEATVEEWEKALAAGSTNMDWETYRHATAMWHLITTAYVGDGAMCPECGRAALDALSTAYRARIGVR